MTQTYSIKDLERLSGIKAHTIRIWEQRYNLLHPQRTTTNIRYYSPNDLKMIINVGFLNQNGYKISKLAGLNPAVIAEEVKLFAEKNHSEAEQINELVIALTDMDEAKFEKILSTNILKIGFINTYERILTPFLTKIGVLWLTDSINPAQEHFITNLIRQKIIVAIDGQMSVISENQKKYLLYLPTNELHELSLLFGSYLVKARGHQSIYLGQSVPFDDLQKVYEIKKPDYLITIFTNAIKQNQLIDYLSKISRAFSGSKILASGPQMAKVEHYSSLPSNIILFRNSEELTRYL